MRHWIQTPLVTLVLLTAAATVSAANTGFLLNLRLNAGNNSVSLPYSYIPQPGEPEQWLQGICSDLDQPGGGDCQVVTITLFTAAGPFTEFCGPFRIKLLEPGVGYVINVAADCTAPVVGAHDDAYSFGRGSATIHLEPRPRINLISVPYHVVGSTAQDLCDFINETYSDDLQALTHFTDVGPFQKACASPFSNFDLAPGEAIFFDVVAAMDIQFQTY